MLHRINRSSPPTSSGIPYLITANMAGNTVTQFSLVVSSATATFTGVQVPGAGMHNVVALLAATQATATAISNQLTLQASSLVDQLAVTRAALGGAGRSCDPSCAAEPIQRLRAWNLWRNGYFPFGRQGGRHSEACLRRGKPQRASALRAGQDNGKLPHGRLLCRRHGHTGDRQRR